SACKTSCGVANQLCENTSTGRIKTLNTRSLRDSAVTGGCGECQTSCQSACKTSCGVANQPCENI
ncbi:MAG: six-cysteine ranthipeptide SCIFF, partial [Oscillospiraceae bacterium]|nr:six-cysteine ranthipeptide SCIFF [Oscillospiraceae bacterium]